MKAPGTPTTVEQPRGDLPQEGETVDSTTVASTSGFRRTTLYRSIAVLVWTSIQSS